MDMQDRPPFDALYVRVRPQIVVDGLAHLAAPRPAGSRAAGHLGAWNAPGEGASADAPTLAGQVEASAAALAQEQEAVASAGDNAHHVRGAAREDSAREVCREDGCEVTGASAAGDGAGALDWLDNGVEVSALTWHQRLQQKQRRLLRGGVGGWPVSHAQTLSGAEEEEEAFVHADGVGVARDGGDDLVLLDCRNGYESDVGKFQGAIPLNTNTFRDTWDALERVLGERDPSKTQVMIYCTGGIRCVKVGAYLKQRMGFQNVSRLQGGVVSYVRELQEHLGSDAQAMHDNSLFRGINYVFDNRLISNRKPFTRHPTPYPDLTP